jgi:hypothetical protein
MAVLTVLFKIEFDQIKDVFFILNDQDFLAGGGGHRRTA